VTRSERNTLARMSEATSGGSPAYRCAHAGYGALAGAGEGSVEHLRAESADGKCLPYRRFYDRMIPVADDLYDVHLAELEKDKDDGRQAFIR
jgi:hypothetical protein